MCNSLPRSSLKLILNALVLSHLHYSAVVIQSNGKNLLVSIEKQINWAMKASFYWSKFESTKELRLEHNILPIKLFMETKRLLYFRKIKSGQLPAFSPKTGQSLATWSVVQSCRTKTLFWNCKFKGQNLQNGFIRTAVKDWNALPESIRNKEQKKDFKSKLIAYQIAKYKSRPDFLSTNHSWHGFKFISTWLAGITPCV